MYVRSSQSVFHVIPLLFGISNLIICLSGFQLLLFSRALLFLQLCLISFNLSIGFNSVAEHLIFFFLILGIFLKKNF